MVWTDEDQVFLRGTWVHMMHYDWLTAFKEETYGY